MTLELLAQAVRSNFKTLQEGEIIGRIMIISGRSFTRAFAGYKLLCEKNLFPAGFIEHYGLWSRLTEQRPELIALIDRLDCIPQKAHFEEFAGFKPPRMISREEAIERLGLSQLPGIPDF